MTRTEQEDAFKAIMEKCGDTLLKKGNDYSTVVDRLSNFKEVAVMENRLPAQVALTMAAVKISRLKSLMNQGRYPEVDNESVEDSWIDLINYAILGYMCHMEHLQYLPKK